LFAATDRHRSIGVTAPAAADVLDLDKLLKKS